MEGSQGWWAIGKIPDRDRVGLPNGIVFCGSDELN